MRARKDINKEICETRKINTKKKKRERKDRNKEKSVKEKRKERKKKREEEYTRNRTGTAAALPWHSRSVGGTEPVLNVFGAGGREQQKTPAPTCEEGGGVDVEG